MERKYTTDPQLTPLPAPQCPSSVTRAVRGRTDPCHPPSCCHPLSGTSPCHSPCVSQTLYVMSSLITLKIQACFYMARYPVLETAQSTNTSPPGRPVHFNQSNANVTSLGSIQPCWNYCITTIRSHINNCP